MFLTPIQTMIMILAIALGTMVTRFLPFALFPENKKTPAFIMYLGKVLPTAMIGLLVVYCFKGVSVVTAPFGIPEMIATLCVVGLHLWKRNVLLSISVGTVMYMVLVQVVF